jgi:hypothetical protein
MRAAIRIDEVGFRPLGKAIPQRLKAGVFACDMTRLEAVPFQR